MGQIDVTENLWTDNEQLQADNKCLRERLAVMEEELTVATDKREWALRELEIVKSHWTKADSESETLRQQVIHHVERIGQQSEIITKLTEGAKARNWEWMELMEQFEVVTRTLDENKVEIGSLRDLLTECLDVYRDEPECRLDHNGWCQAHDCDNPCLAWRIKQLLRE
jgi:predicted  nucleic acid-binding Zn-ribbon protein